MEEDELYFKEWLELGTRKRVARKYNQPDRSIAYKASRWAVKHSEEAIALVLAKSPATSRTDVEKQILIWAARYYKTSKDKFLNWVSQNPWAQKYKKYYDEYFEYVAGSDS